MLRIVEFPSWGVGDLAIAAMASWEPRFPPDEDTDEEVEGKMRHVQSEYTGESWWEIFWGAWMIIPAEVTYDDIRKLLEVQS